jgi:hypothetical protein
MSRQPACEDSDAIGARLRELQAERLAALATPRAPEPIELVLQAIERLRARRHHRVLS